MELDKALELVREECKRARERHIPFQSPHEGYAIIKEELDELWSAIRRIHHHKERNRGMRTEAIHVSAMALRFLVDLVEE